MKNKLKNNSGFTLLEVMISITIIAFVSTFILKMFLVSSDLNLRAHDMDIGALKVSNVVEYIQSEDVENSFFDGTIVEADESELRIYKFYDKEWNKIESSEEEFSEEKVDSEVRFVMEVKAFRNIVSPNMVIESFQSTADGVLTSTKSDLGEYLIVDATIYYFINNKLDRKLISIHSSMYDTESWWLSE